MALWMWLVLTVLLAKFGLAEEYCPKKCICEKTGSKWVKLKCGGKEDVIDSISEIDFDDVRTNLLQLNLTSNHIINISGLNLPSLRKFDASRNQISLLSTDTFIHIPELKQLDLSHNLITKIKKETFQNLNSLKQIDISNNPLTCDCELLETVEWLQNRSTKLLSNPKCTFPNASKTQFIKKLKVGVHLDCGSSTEIEEKATIRLLPSKDQIVFEGDSLKLNCLASGVHHASDTIAESSDNHETIRVSWSWLDQNIENQFAEIENKYMKYGGVIDSSLYISKLNRNHTGHWKCQLLFQNQTATQTKAILVVVISNVTQYCPISVTNNNKGIYTWPKTISGYSVDLPCQVNENMKAYHSCSPEGTWLEPNTTQCAYVSEITRILEQFSKVNLTLTKVNVFDSANHLKNYTSDLLLLKDKMDVIYIARTIRNYLDFLSKEKEVGAILADIANNVQQLPRVLLEQANEDDGSCSKLIEAMEVVSEYTSISQGFFASQEYKIKRDVFLGMTCTWYTEQGPTGIRKNPELQCSSTRDTWQPVLGEKTMEASVQIPATLFNQVIPADRVVTSHRMFIGMYTTGKLFPAHLNNTTDVYTSVVGVKLVNIPVTNLSSPIYVMMRIADGPAIPAVWDSSLNNGTGGWNTKGCQLSHYLHENVIVFTCNYLGYYAVLQDIQYLEDRNVIHHISGAKFRLSHPAAYIGGVILFVCMLLSIVTYLKCYKAIQMAKKAKHSLINMWIAIVWLCYIYTFGIYQTEDLYVCQAVGIIIHYLTLSVLLWMCVAVSNMYKRLNKSEQSAILTDDSLQGEQPVQKPILGLYLVGWGVALIVCGISGAVNMREYASYSFCFLDSPPALSAVFIPVIILLIAISVFLLMIRCTIRNNDTQMTQLSEGTQGTENLDLDLLEPNLPNCGNLSVKSASTSSSMIEDCEHAPMTQLRAHLIVLIMYILMWVCAAISTTKPFNSLAYEEDLFNILYALMASSLGMFTVFFYCIARSDVRTEWMNIRIWTKKNQFCCRSRSVSDRNVPVPTVTQANAEVQVTSRSSSRNSSQPKSISQQSNNLKGAAGLNEETVKTGHVDLVVLHRQQYRTNNTIPIYELSSMNGAEIFYNPHQIGVAKKFFRKQKRNMMKHNNLGTRHSRDNRSVKSQNSDMSSSLFGPGAKVNNTNIHIEQIKDTKHSKRNPNILSDNYDIDYQNERLSTSAVQQLLSTKKLKSSNKKPKNNYDPPPPPAENMRTVSQQCSLEYTSDPLEEPVKSSEPKIYVNPMENLPYTEWNKVGSLRSSLSTSDVDELYSQIRHGRNRNSGNKSRRHTLDERHLSEMEARNRMRYGGPSCTSSPTRRSETRL